MSATLDTPERSTPAHGAQADDGYDDVQGIDLREWLQPLRARWRSMAAAPFVFGAVAIAASFLVTPVFSSRTTFLPPQQQQSGAAGALASLGALAGLAGGAGIKSPVDQYVALLQSETVGNRMIDRFKLMQAYDLKYKDLTRKELARRSDVGAGKKDGLIYVEVRDTNPARAAEMANAYVEELRHLTSTLAVSEAQQRRVFFENQLQETKTRLVAAQTALQRSGFNAGAIKAEPRALAESYAKARAELAAAQVRLQTLQGSRADSSAEVRQQTATVGALQSQLHSLENSDVEGQGNPDYIGKYREFKYQETLFDLMAKQYEIARVDESREGALIQVVDVASPAEHKIAPKRSLYALGGAFVGTLALGLIFIVRARRRATNQAAPS